MTKKAEIGIYVIRNTVTLKVYVGSSIDIKERWYRHRLYLDRGTHASQHLQAAWKTYGKDAFSFQVLEIVGDVAELLKREQAWIDQLRACDREYGYNQCPVAGSRAGTTMSAEARAKISAGNSGRPLTEERRRKIALSNTGKRHSDESKAKMSAARKGIPRQHSDEARAKLSAAHMGKILSEEHRRKLSEAHKGKQSTPESRAKASAALKGRSKSPETRARMALAQRKRFANDLGSQQ